MDRVCLLLVKYACRFAWKHCRRWESQSHNARAAQKQIAIVCLLKQNKHSRNRGAADIGNRYAIQHKKRKENERHRARECKSVATQSKQAFAQ